MDSEASPKELTRSAEPAEGDTAVAKKRLRRVSFAERTAVHFFKRDEDYETPPDSKPAGAEGSSGPATGSEPLGFQGVRTGDDDSRSPPRREKGGWSEEEEEEEEDGGDEEHELFVRRDVDSSPGSTAGSLTSNDDENLFGPVSTSFIRSGRLSDVSDDSNHDITLDSTAFSMHFSNVLPTDDRSINSGRSPRTPTGDPVTKDSGDFIALSGTKKKVPDLFFAQLKSSGGTGYSSDMTLVAENSNSYDYGKLPPTLEVLLAKVNEAMQPQHSNDSSESLASYKCTTESPEDCISEESPRNVEVVAFTGMVEPRSGENLEACRNGEYHNRGIMVAATDMVVTDTPSRSSCSHNTGTGPPAGPSTGEIDQVIFSPVHEEAKDDICQANLPSLMPADASITEVISLSSEEPQKHLSLNWDHMPGSHLVDRTAGNEYHPKFSHVSASDVPAQRATNADKMTLDSHEGRTHTPTSIQNRNQHMLSPVESSISCLRAKRQQLFEDASVSLQSGWHSSSLMLQTPLSSKRKIILCSEGGSIIKPSVAKFDNFEMAESIGSKNRTFLSAIDCRFHGYKAVVTESYNSAEPFNISVSKRREQVTGISGGVAGMEMNSEIHIHGLETPSNIRKLTCDEENRGITDTRKQTEDMIQIPGSGMSMRQSKKSLNSESPIQGASSSTFSSSKQRMLEIMENRQVSNTLSGLASSPMSLLGQKLSLPQDQCLTSLASRYIKSSSLLGDMRSETTLSRVAFSFSETRKVDDKNATPETSMVSQFPWKESEASDKNFCSINQNGDCNLREDLGSKTEKIAHRRLVSPLPDVYKKATTINESEEVTEHPLIDQSPSIVPDHLRSNDVPQAFHLRNTVSQDPVINSEVNIHAKQSFALFVDDIVGQKRKANEVPIPDDTIIEPGKTQKSQKDTPAIEDNISGFSPAQQRQCFVRDNEAYGELMRTGLLTRIVDGTKQPFSPSINTLNLQELDILDDLICELQRARKYERLCTDLQTVGKHHGPDHQKSVSEVRWLNETLLYEQAKLQLKRIKHDRLLKRAHELQSRIHDFSKLRSCYMQMIDRQLYLPPVSVPNNTVPHEHQRVSSLRNELEFLNEKINGFVKFIATSCNLSEDLGCDEIIKVVNDNSEKRNRCRAVRQHLQLWKLADVVTRTDQCDIVLNYHNLLSQRFNIRVAPASRFGVEVLLNDANIEKSFPNMKASTAFRFIFAGSEGYKRLANIKCFQKETQATSFILGNLLDVLQEIQFSLIESPNLMSSSFCAQSAGKLKLQLYFLDVKSGRNVALSLDVTYLNCAVYPSDPSELKIEISCSGLASSQSVSDEIMGAVRRLKGGHMVLMQLCHCVSQLIQASEV